MTTRETMMGFAVLATVLLIVGIIAFVAINRHQAQVEMNAQTEIEKTRIEQEAKIERTKERWSAVPWHREDRSESE